MASPVISSGCMGQSGGRGRGAGKVGGSQEGEPSEGAMALRPCYCPPPLWFSPWGPSPQGTPRSSIGCGYGSTGVYVPGRTPALVPTPLCSLRPWASPLRPSSWLEVGPVRLSRLLS